MSFLRKTILSIFVLAMLLGVSPFLVKADSDQELRDFLETLITLGVIPSNKADLARTILNSALSDSSTRINRELKKGSIGDDVKLLQKVLNTNPATIVASSGVGSSGNETTYFGTATEAAVIKFQNLYGFRPTGIVDEETRAKINALLSVITNADIPEADRPSVDLKVNGQDDKVQVGYNGVATVIWISKNVISCVSETNKVKPIFGTESFIATSSTQLIMTCSGPKGIVSDTVTLSVARDGQSNNPTLTILGTNDPNHPTTDNNPSVQSLNVYVNSQKDYSTTTPPSISSTHVVSWVSNGFTACKATSIPTTNGLYDTIIPSEAIRSGSVSIVIPPASTGRTNFTLACATGTTAIATLNQSSVSSLNSSTNLKVSSASLTVSNSTTPTPTPTPTTKSVDIYVEGVKNYSTTTTSDTIESEISWDAPGFAVCKINSVPAIDGVSEAMAWAKGSTTITSKFSAAGSISYNLTIACATGTVDMATFLRDPVSSFTPSEDLKLNTATMRITYAPSTTLIGPADVAKIVGYGPVNYWMGINSLNLALQLSASKLTTTHIELFSMGPTGDAKPNYENPANIKAPLKTFIANMRAAGITTFIDFVNWNYEDICSNRYDDAWFNSALDFLINEIGTDKVILQIGGEFGGSCEAKALHWNEIAFAPNTGKWKGMKSWNKTGSPTSAPDSSWFFDYHPCSITNYGPNGAIITTDCGGILNAIGQGGDGMAFADTAKLKAYACNVLKDGKKGFIYYGYGHQAIDSNAIVAIGQAINESKTGNCAPVVEEGCEPGIVVNFSGVVEAVSQCVGSASGYQIIIGPYSTDSAGNQTKTTYFQSTYTVANPSCRDVNPYDTATALALYDHSTDHNLKVGDCVLGTANGNRDAACEQTEPPATCEGISNGNVKAAASDGGLMVAGVIQDIESGSCTNTGSDSLVVSTSEDGSGGDDGGGGGIDWFGWTRKIWGYTSIGTVASFYDYIGSDLLDLW